MSPRRRIPDVPPHAPPDPGATGSADAVTKSETINPLQESSAEVWARWSHEREAREVQRKVNRELEQREAANLPIYPRECAERIAQETHAVAPDWRHIRPTLGPAWGRLLKAQPELAADLTAQREATITAVFNSVPRHLRASVNDLRLLIDLMLTAREAAAYHVGFESGRLTERAMVDGRGRTVAHPRPHVRRVKRPDGATGEGGA